MEQVADAIESPAAIAGAQAPALVIADPPSERLAGSDFIEAEILVEEVSIDGMCGVY